MGVICGPFYVTHRSLSHTTKKLCCHPAIRGSRSPSSWRDLKFAANDHPHCTGHWACSDWGELGTVTYLVFIVLFFIKYLVSVDGPSTILVPALVRMDAVALRNKALLLHMCVSHHV